MKQKESRVLNKEILKLAIPNILSNLSVPLLSAVDTALMGQLSPIYLGAIGLGAMIFNFIYWNFGFLRMGTTGMTSQAYGARDHAKTYDLLTASLRLSLIIAGGIVLLSPLLFDWMGQLLLVQEVHHSTIVSYTSIRIYDAPATIMLYALTGWFFGRQNAMIPLAITVSINVMNMVISYVLVQTYGLNIAGVAWGTVVSQYAGVMMMMLIVITKYDYSIRRLFRSRITIAMGQFFSVNRDLFIRTILLTLSFAILYRYSNRLGTLELAANVVILQLLNWISFGVDGFAYAAESVVGKYMGRKDSKKVLDVVRLCIYWGGAIALIYTLLFLCASGAIVGLYTLDLAVSNHISMLKPWVVALPLISFVCYIFDGIFIGLLESKLMRDSMIISFGVFMLSMSFLSHNNVILWSSFCVFLLLRGLVQIYYWHQKIKVRLMRS